MTNAAAPSPGGEVGANPKLLVFETHPIQYRAPIFQHLQTLRPDSFEVIYASDFSVRGDFVDREFGKTVSWDEPLLSGYRYRVLGNDAAGGPERFGGLTGRGVDRLVGELRPGAIWLNSLGYRFAFAAYLAALRRRIPIWYRADTNERAFHRGRLKGIARAIFYRGIYAGIARGLYVGELNRRHLRKFGVAERRLTRVPHCTPDRLIGVADAEMWRRRAAARARIGALPDEVVLGFFGKLIPKKNPPLLFEAIAAMAPAQAAGLRCLIVGTGEQEAMLRAAAARIAGSHGVATHFAGFVNQSGIDDFYLATDILVLPSERAGETWGLVVNEALNAGCAAILSDEVGSAADFGDWERVRVIPAGDAAALAGAIDALRRYPRAMDWADGKMARYTARAAAQALAELIDGITPRG